MGRGGAAGEGQHQHRGGCQRGGVGHGLSDGQLEQLPIADRPGRPAMALPCVRQSECRPAQLMGGAGDGGIGAAGTAMEQPLHRPTAAGGDHKRADRDWIRPG